MLTIFAFFNEFITISLLLLLRGKNKRINLNNNQRININNKHNENGK